MAKKLRIRFIVITMLSVVAVLGIIMLAINLSNYARVAANADEVLTELQRSGGTFDPNDGQFARNKAPQDERFLPNGGATWDAPFLPNKDRLFNEETPFETRYFSVDFATDPPMVNVNNIAAVGAQEALAMAQKARQTTKKSGYVYGQYRYLVSDDGNMVLFVDCNRQLLTARNFLNISLIVSAAGIAAVFLLVFLLSKKAVQPIAQAYERQKQFVTEAGHELKTPITIISANNELLQMEYGDNESTDAIEHEVKRLAAMVKNLVSLARLDEQTTVTMADCAISDCVAEQLELANNALCANGRTVSADIDADIVGKGNTDLLGQLVSILLDNAIKYARTYTAVSLHKGKTITLTVANDADDLTDGDKSRCFERFYREAGARATVDGSGIGLAIAKQIVQLHRGSIAANAKDGVFCVTVQL